MKKTIRIFLAVVVMLIILPAALVLAAPVGKITALEGRVDITPKGAKDAVPVAVGTEVNTGDILRAKSKAKAEVTFVDGNMMRIAESTRIRITQYNTEPGQKSYFNLFRGKTQAVVDRLKKGANFEVHTPTAICGVRGSIFISMFINGQSSFVFSRGAGYGYNINQPDKIVAIPTKILMVVPRADKAPMLRPATESEVDKHLKDTTPLEKPKEKEAAKEEKKPAGGDAQAKQEAPPPGEAKKEEAKPAAQEKQTTETAPATTTATTTETAPAPATIDTTQVEQQLQQSQQSVQTQQTVQTQPTQPQPVIEPPKDNTPPTITYTAAPAATTNDDTATLSYSTNEKSDFQYRVDNGGWQSGPTAATGGSTTLADLAEGSHTYEVKATDALGNTSTKAYSWTTDYAGGPPVNISPQAAVPADNGKTDLDVNLSSTDTTYKYKLDNGDYQTTDPAFTISGLGAGTHTLYAFGRDDAGKRGQEFSRTFTIHRYNDFPGKIWFSDNDLTSETVTGKIAAPANDTWGSWIIASQGTGALPSFWTSYAGKANPANDAGAYFWLNQASGSAAGDVIDGSSLFMRYLTWNTLGEGSNGTVTGTYSAGDWSMKDTGKGLYTEKDLKFASLIGAWNGSGQQEARSLTYGKNRDFSFTKVTSSTAPVRMELTWESSQDLDSHAWVPAAPARAYPVHVYYAAKGNTGYNKFLYPAAYLDNDKTSGGEEKTLYSGLYRGDAYFSVYNYDHSDGPVNSASLKVYQRLFKDHGTLAENAGTLLDTRTGSIDAWRHLYKLSAPADPAGTYDLYYADYSGSAYPLDNEYVANSTIQGMLGGAQSIVTGTATDIPIYLIGRHTLDNATMNYNRAWSLDLVPYDSESAQATKYLTKDGGTYLGFLGGILRPATEYKSIEGLLTAIYLDPAGKTGLLKGSFGDSGSRGDLYPGLAMWTADGTVNRYDLGKDSGLNPANLSGQWYYVPPGSSDPKDSWTDSNSRVVRSHYSSWDWNDEMHRSLGMFFAGTSQLTETIPMTAREDYIDTYRIKMDGSPTSGDTFGVWNWAAYGGYGETKANWLMAAHGRILEYSWYATKTRAALRLFAGGNTAWTDGRFNGSAAGFGGDGDTGKTYVYGGAMLGTYNSWFSFFNAQAAGSFLETDKYLAMMASSETRDALSDLGYQTEETALATDQPLDGSLAADPNKAARISGLRVFSYGGNDPLKLGVANNLTASAPWRDQALYPITGNDDRYPVYGILGYNYDYSTGSDTGTWLGQAGAFGAFRLPGGGVRQIAWGDYAAGSYTAGGFSGTVGGVWTASPYLSELTRYPYTNPAEADPNLNKRAYLWYYAGASPTTEGYLKGLLGTSDPSLWPDTASFSSYPHRFQADVYGVWLPPQGSAALADYRSHIFKATLFPANFESGTVQNPVYTTTTGHSYWGHLRGIHQYYNNYNYDIDGMQALFAGVFVDKNNNAGLVGASMGQANWGFDRDKNAFVMYNRDGVLVALDTLATGGTTAANLVSRICPETAGNNNYQNFSLAGGVISSDDPTLMGRFYSGTTVQGEPLRIPANTSFTLGANWISDVNRDWGIWQTEIYGSYASYEGDHWFGELRQTSDSPRKPAGMLIIGESWQDGDGDAKQEFQGVAAGYFADITTDKAATPLTGILYGNLLGVYGTSGDTNGYYGAVATGSFFATNRYLEMTGTAAGRMQLANLNIPAVQVGSVNLSGSNADYGLSVTMNGVKFFAYNTGAMPMLWATNGVTGSYSQAQQAGNWADLASPVASLKTRFKLLGWYPAEYRWTAEVNGSGDIGETANLLALNIRGAAAGELSGSESSGDFSGTAAGIVNKEQASPPVVTIDSGPKAKTNAHDAAFTYSANRPIQTWSYRVDSGDWTDTNDSSVVLSNMSQAAHSFEIKGTDSNGNVSDIKTWSWETNYVKPTLSATPKSASPDGETTGTIAIALAGSKSGSEGYTGTYEYKIDGGSYQTTAADLQASVTAGARTITTRTTDEYGNVSDEATTAFTLTRHNAGGKMWATGMETATTDVQTKFAGVTGQTWGGWKTTAGGSGTPAASWQAYAGGEDDATRTYWLSRSSGTAANGQISGTSHEMTFLKLYKGDPDWSRFVMGVNNSGATGATEGTYTGINGSATWNTTDAGSGIYTEQVLKQEGDLSTSELPGRFKQWNATNEQMDTDANSTLTGLIVSTQSLWSSPALHGLGGMTNNNNWKLWSVGISGAADEYSGRYRGALGGILKPLIADENRYPLEGLGQAIYIRTLDGVNKTGYFKFNDIQGFAYPGIAMWQNSGNLAGPGDSGDTIYTPAQLDDHLVYTDPQKRTISYDVAMNFTGRLWTRQVYLDDQTSWRLAMGEMGGSYDTAPPLANTGGLDMNSGTEVNYSIGTMSFDTWSNDRLQGTMTSGQLGWRYKGTTDSDFLGNLLPASPGAYTGTWQAVSRGVQDREALAFASLIGEWGADGTRRRAPLSYLQKPVYEKILIADTLTSSLRIETTYTSASQVQFDGYAWIPPANAGNRYFPVFFNSGGVQGWNKYRYPAAYYAEGGYYPNRSYNRVNLALFQPGNSYFSVNRSGLNEGYVTVTVYDGDGNEITSSSATMSTEKWWNLYVLETPEDPELAASLYRYDRNESEGILSDSSIMAYNLRQDQGGVMGILGGTQSLIRADVTTDIPIRMMGSYTGATALNRFWGQQLVAFNADNGKYITYDDKDHDYAGAGAFFGQLGGVLRPEAQRVQGVFSAFAIKPTGEAGLLRGSFGTGEDQSPRGVIYPNLVVQDDGQPEKRLWEADGSVSRYDMNLPTGITPSALTGRWFQIDNEPGAYSLDYWEGGNNYLGRLHASSWDESRQMHRSGNGIFLDGAGGIYTTRAYLTDRQDYLDIYKLNADENNTIGIWSWRSLGAYGANQYDQWVMNGEFRNSNQGDEKFKAHVFGYGNTWTGGKFTGKNMGYVGDGDIGFTGLMAGDMVGSYNDGISPGGDYAYDAFGAVATGSWLRTEKYLDLVDTETGRQTLAGLGYLTAEMPLTAAARELTGGTVAISGFRVFSPPDNSIINLFASRNVSANAAFTQYALYPVAGTDAELPVYGVMQANYVSTGDAANWLGELRGLGVFAKTDNTKFQAAFSGIAAGAYGMDVFSGTAAGDFTPTPFLGELSNTEKTMYLKYYDKYYNEEGGMVNEGHLRGLLGAWDPVVWTENSSYPLSLDLHMVGVWDATPEPWETRHGHIFNTVIYPKNFLDGTYTATNGASFWGYLSGIHQLNQGDQDGIESLFASVFVDKNKQAGFLLGKIGGPDAWDEPYGWGFDYHRQAFSADSQYSGARLIQFGETGAVTAATLKDSIHSMDYTYQGGVFAPEDQAVIGSFYNQDEQTGNPITMANTGTATSSFINDAKVNGNWGVWSTELYGGYGGYLPNHDHWLGELQTPDVEGETPTKIMGATIYGEPWRNNRIEGSVLGYWANIDNAVTGISFGKLLGTFDPQQFTYQAVVAGAFMETGQFLTLAEDPTGAGRNKLRDLNVPCVSVGQVNLLGENNALKVSMANVKFFAYATGQVPHIWATNAVDGIAKIANPTGSSVALSGNGGNISADFTMKNWNTAGNTWLGAVTNGQGNIGTAANQMNLQFRGAAAGPITGPGQGGTAFSGTAAGVVRQVAPPAY